MAGKCPKCGVPFVVPPPPDPAAVAGLTPPGAALAVEGGSSASENPVSMGSGTGNEGLGEVFVFLCPNGHRLNGPPSMKGKAGQCPHCKARFRIPDDEDLDEQSDQVDELGEDEESDPADEFSLPDFSRLGQASSEEVEDVEELPVEIEPPPAGMPALGYIVGRLWDHKTDDTELEIFLNEGEIMQPEYYSETLSSSEFGVFAIREGDGTYTVNVVPWAQVRKLGMRKIPDLSPSVFRKVEQATRLVQTCRTGILPVHFGRHRQDACATSYRVTRRRRSGRLR